MFDPLLHTELVRIVNDRQEVSTEYIDGVLNRNIIQSSDLLTFAVSLIFLGFISTSAVHVTGFLKGQSLMIRRNTV